MLILCGLQEPGTECRGDFEMTGTGWLGNSWEHCLGRSPSYLLLSGRGMRSSLRTLGSRHSSHCPQLPKNPVAPEFSHSLQAILCHFFPNVWNHSLEGMSVLSWFLRWRLYNNLRKRRKGMEVRGEIQESFTNGRSVLWEVPGTGDLASLGLRFAWWAEVSWLEKLGEG